ncbi:DUF6777 domain-containing protein [Streptomyces sp. NBC_00102]|uniref:DUF6777 domain-containing protein n=1 Tax=Streptomyces sp. NBC_00102 TaxID=2975652 RepID=UPI002258E6C1|nr:DUF6777 domain-containing protein [Streptomyces sp. NBC_00102]MCX5402208.1 hypothetical protein [Streptomyces sp. NBC_00102]
MRSSRRLPYALSAVVSVAALSAAGCSGASGHGAARPASTAVGHEVLLQPAAARGPAPFTASTAGVVPGAEDAQPLPAGGPPAEAQAVHVVTGDAAGLYGGVRDTPGCDVDAQADLLSEDSRRARAFARVAGIEAVQIPGYLRALTPVVLRADVRVTDHGFAAGAPTSFQTVLQSGTAVMVDSRGLPRVRCASGNPLAPAVPLTGRIADRGERWAGYAPDRVLDIEPSARALESLVIADLVEGTWIERPSGYSAEDKNPAAPPAADPGAGFFPFAPDASDGSPQESGGDADSGVPAPGSPESDEGARDLPDFTGDGPAEGLPDFTGDGTADGLPDFTGEPDFGPDGLPDFAGDGIPDFTGDAGGAADLPDFTGEADAGLPDFTGGADSAAQDAAGDSDAAGLDTSTA